MSENPKKTTVTQQENSKTQDIPLNPIKKKHGPLKLTNKNLLTRLKYGESISPLKGLTKTQKKKELKMTEEEKEANRKILYNMNLKLNFVKNPRYRENIPPPLFTDDNFQPIDSPNNAFSVNPKIVIFKDYQMGSVYQIDVKILNRTQLLTSFKYIPPHTENFTIKDIIYPKRDSALIAPGMNARIQVLFHATSMDNFEDDITILTERMKFKIPLKAIRDKPAITLVNPMDCGKCFIGDRVEMHFTCKNNGGDAHFKFLPMDNNTDTEGNGVSNNVPNELLNIPPFSIFPQEFYLYRGMSQNISITFIPTDEGIVERNLTLFCESAVLNYILKGEGIKVDIIISKLDGLSMEDEVVHNVEEEKKSNDDSIKVNNDFDNYGNEEEDELHKNLRHKDENIIKTKPDKLDTLFFPDTFPYTSNSRVLSLKNTSSVPIKYHWSIYDFYHQNEFSMAGDDNFFSIEPEDGTFQPYEEISFTIKFNPLNSIVYEQKLDLVIEDIPFPAIKQFITPSNPIKNTFSKAEPYLPGFNSAFPSYPLYSFNLRGMGTSPYLECDKNIIDLGDVYIGEEVMDTFKIFNPKTGKCLFKARKIYQKLLTKRIEDNEVGDIYKENCIDEEIIFRDKIPVIEGLTLIKDDSYGRFDYKTNLEHTDVNCLEINMVNNCDINNEIKGDALGPLIIDKFIQILQNETVNFEIKFKCDKIGIFKSSIIFCLDDGMSLSIDIKANVIGPKLIINTPYIDFGLFSISTIQKKEFEIENSSPIPLTYLIKESRFKSVNFETFKDNDYIDNVEGEITDKIYKNKIESLIDYDNNYMNRYDTQKTDSYQMKFSSAFGVLSPHEKKTIEVYFISPYPINLGKYNTIEILSKYSCDNSFINFTGRCEEAIAYIEDTIIKPKQIFLTMPIIHKKNKVTIINPSNLPVHFKWDNVFEAEKLTAEFEPNEGIINPHSKIDIKYKIVYFFLAQIDDLFICHIEEMDIPLGIVVQGQVIGLDISYFYTQKSYDYLQKLNSTNFEETKKSTTENNKEHNLAKTGLRKNKKYRTVKLAEDEDEEEKFKRLQLTEITMSNLKVNTPTEISFKIKNLSGIPTNFNLSVKNYPPAKEKVAKPDKDQVITNITRLSRMSRKSKKDTKFKIDHPLLTAEHEKINFTSPKGLEFTKQKEIEEDSILYLSHKKGVAIVIEPKRGKLPPHAEIQIKFSVFNECVGDFSDVLISRIKGLDQVEFPINLRIKGNPIQLAPFQPGINYLLDPPLLKMGYLLRNVGEIVKNVRFINIGTNTINLDWKIYDYESFLKPQNRDIVNLKISEPTQGKFTLNFNPIPPNEFPPEKTYFTIDPTHAVVMPKSISDFSVTFKTDSEGMKESLFIAYPYIENDDSVKFNELELKVIGGGLKPHLVVDRETNIEGKYVYNFVVHSYGRHPRPKRPIILINKEKINMIIKIDIEGPFKIINTEPIEASLGNSTYNIIPNSNLKIDIKYLIPNVNDEKNWPMTLVNEKNGKMIVTYENGESEIYYLKAYLKRPRILLSLTGNESVESLDYIDFGYVNCASHKVEKMYLLDDTEVDTNWKINYVKFIPKKLFGYGTITKEEKEDIEMSDDESVFTFDIADGIIYGPSEMLINLPIGPVLPKVETTESKKYKPLIIHVTFSPKKNVLYKCRYKITTSTGNTIDFLLKGYGSYLEEHIIE